MIRAATLIRAAEIAADLARKIPFDVAVLASDERHVRRKVITLVHGDRLLVDFPEPLVLADRDVLVLEDGRHAEIVAAEEELLAVRGRDPVHLAGLAWHIGNRHLAAAIEAGRILILRDHVIKAMLEGLGAEVSEVVEPFDPLGGAYSGGGHGHAPAAGAHPHGHAHGHDHEHEHEHEGHRHETGHSHGHSATQPKHAHDG